MTATSLDLMWINLEACDSDPVVMSQAIDCLIDSGDERTANAVKWMLENGKWPHRISEDYHLFQDGFTYWWRVMAINKTQDEAFEIKHDFRHRLSGQTKSHWYYDYRSFADAVIDLGAALEKLNDN